MDDERRRRLLMLWLLFESPYPSHLLDSPNMWVHPINKKRDIHGEYHHLMSQLREDRQKFKDYFRLSPEAFDYILECISPAIYKQTTNFRKPIGPEERLCVTLR